MTWYDGKEKCESMGSNLPIPRSQEENQFYRNLYAQLGQPVPWNYWQIRDSRTLFNMLPKDPRKDVQMDLHNALADCYFQAKSVQKAYKNFGVKKR